MRITRFLICCLTTALVIVPQLTIKAASWLQGRISEESSGNPIIGATIRIAEHKGIAISDADGYFLLKTELSGNQKLFVSCLGYASLEQLVNLPADDTLTTDFSLSLTITEIRGVVVRGERQEIDPVEASQPVSVITDEQFVEQNFSTTAELLREEPGVLVQKTTAGHGAPVIRGLIGRHVLLLYDGLRLNRPTFRFGANQYMNTIGEDWLGSIVVSRGPTSVLFGSDALGGAVNMVSWSPGYTSGPLRYSTLTQARYSSADEGYSISTRVAASGQKLSGWAGVTRKDIGNLKAGGDIGTQEPTGWDELNFIGQANYLFGNQEISVQYLSTNMNKVPRYDRYESGKFTQYVYDPQDRKMAIVSLQSLKSDGLRSASRFSLSWSQEDEGQIEQRTGSDAVTHSDQRVTTWGGFGQTTIVPEQDCHLTFGSEYYADKVLGTRFVKTPTETTEERPAYPDGSTYHSFGLYTEYARPLAWQSDITVGFRYSAIGYQTDLEAPFGVQDESFSNFTSSISLVHHLSPDYNLLVRWARGFRAPNLNDLAVLSSSSSGFDVPSPGLDPETSDDYDIGFRIDKDRLTGSAYLFYSRIHDFIDRRPGTYAGLTFYDENDNGVQDSTEAEIYQKKNVGEGEIYGVEIDLNCWLGEVTRLHTNIFYTRGENTSDDEPLSRIAPLMGNFSLRHFLKKTTWVELLVRAATEQRRLSQRDIDDDRIGPNGTDSWGTFNLRAATQWQRFNFNLALINLTDKGYKEHGSGVWSPGRGVNLGVTFR